MIKITVPNGKYSIIAIRNDEKLFPIPPKSISTNEPQPWIGMNYDASGNCVGGRTLTESGKQAILANAEKAVWKVEYADRFECI